MNWSSSGVSKSIGEILMPQLNFGSISRIIFCVFTALIETGKRISFTTITVAIIARPTSPLGITSIKNTTSLLENALEKSVELNKDELKDYSTLNSTQVDEIYSAILKDSDNLISESIAANISFRLNDTIKVFCFI